MQQELESYFDRLWPICRSLTGDGVRQSLQILQEIIPLELHEMPSGTTCFDWTVPDEWNIRDAFILTPSGEKICELSKNNLHILGYSEPVDREMSWEELAPHLHTLPEMPDAVPYLTSYYRRTWGFCLPHRQWESLPREGRYRVRIDSTLAPGHMTYGDLLLKGETEREIIFSSYICHPSMANNELSGPLTLAFLYRAIAAMPRRRFTYRFILIPETIGAIAYLSQHGKRMKEKVKAGYVLTCTGDRGGFTYKNSKDESADVNRVARHVLRHSETLWRELPFTIGGSDERQYCSPGFNLPVGSLMRTPYQQYREYHTSLDNKSFLSFAALEETVQVYLRIVRLHELNRCYRNTVPYGEPQLGKRGLYPALGGQKQRADELSRRLHLLSFADGRTDLITIADRVGADALDFAGEIELLSTAGLLTCDD